MRGGDEGLRCTGVIIGKSHILTAAHCYDNRVWRSGSPRYDEEIPNRRIYFGIYDTEQRNRANPNPKANPHRRAYWRLPKSIKGLYRCTSLLSCEGNQIRGKIYKLELYNRVSDTPVNLLTESGIREYNIDRNLIDLALVWVDTVTSIDDYWYRGNGNDVNNVFRALKAAELDKIETNGNTCKTCSGDCDSSKVFNAQGWGRFSNKISVEIFLLMI